MNKKTIIITIVVVALAVLGLDFYLDFEKGQRCIEQSFGAYDEYTKTPQYKDDYEVLAAKYDKNSTEEVEASGKSQKEMDREKDFTVEHFLNVEFLKEFYPKCMERK